MSNNALQILQRLLEAMNAHDADGVAALMTEDVSFAEPTFAKPRLGREAVRQEMAGFFAMLPDITFDLQTVAVTGDVAMCEFGYSATFEGKAISLRECSVSRVNEEGLFAEVRVYFDRMTLLRQLGIPPAEWE